MLNVDGKVDIAQYFVICSASNDRLVRAITKCVEDNAHKFSVKAKSIEGQKESQWVLLDFSSVVVHVFLQDARDYYRIERLFKDAKELSWQSLDRAVS